MTVKTWDDMKIKYPMERHEMTPDQEDEFLKDSFYLCESGTISDVFWTPWSDKKEYIGKKFEIVSRCTDSEVDLECLPQWNIKFEDGTVFNAMPEEIILSEMIDNGYMASVEVPDESTLEEAIQYANSNIRDIPILRDAE